MHETDFKLKLKDAGLNKQCNGALPLSQLQWQLDSYPLG